MITGTVVGSLISTRKNSELVGYKFLIVKQDKESGESSIVAVDTVGAGVGERVIISVGSAARLALSNTSAPVDASIVGILDE